MINIFDLGKFGTEVILDTSKFDRGMSQVEGKTNSFSSKLGGFGKRIGTFAAGAVTGILGAVGAFSLLNGSIDGAISRYDTLNNFPRVLQMLGFDAEESQKAIDRLSEGIDGLPTTLDSVASTAQRIAGMTGDLDGAVETTLALNNAFLASGASSADAERGLEQYVQMLSKGEVDLQSWRSLQETMPVALNKTAEAFGMTGASAQNDLYDALRDGHITFDEFNEKIIELSETQGGFAEMAQESTGGIATSWQNMKTAVVKGVTDVIGAVDEALGGVGSIAGIIDILKAGIQEAFSWIVALIPEVIGAIQSVITWFQELGTSAESSFSGIGEAFRQVIDFISELGQQYFETFENIITGFVEMIVPFIQEFLTMIYELWQENGQQIIETVTIIYTTIFETIETIYNAIFEIIQTILGLILPFIQEKLQLMFDFWREHGQGIMEVVQQGFQFIQDTIEFIMPIIVAIIEGAWDIITTVFDTAINVVMGFVEYFAAMLEGDFEGMKEASITIFTALWDGIKGIVEGAWGLLSGAFGALWDEISGWFIGLKDDAFEWGANMVDGFVEGIKSIPGKVADAAKSVVDSAADYLKFWSPAKKGEGRFITHWGRNMVDGFLDGVKEESAKAGQVVNDMIKSMSPSALDYSINASGTMASSVTPYMTSRGRNLPSGSYGNTTNNHDTQNTNHLHLHVNIDKLQGGKDGAKTLIDKSIEGFEKMGFKLSR